jgi:hypothetical protein
MSNFPPAKEKTCRWPEEHRSARVEQTTKYEL